MAALLRLLGITWGLPGETHLFSYHPDEYFSLQAALSLLTSDPNPHFFNYPSLYLYLSAAACMIADGSFAAGATVQDLPEVLRVFTLDARLVTVLLSVLTVGAAYAVASRIAGRRAGLLAAAILAVAPGHVLYSHFAAVDVPLALFTTLSLLAAVALLTDTRPKGAILAGLAVGAAAATKYNGALAIVMPLLALGMRFRRSPGSERASAVKHALLVIAVAALTFFLCSPYVVLDWGTAGGHIAFEREHMRVGDGPAKVADPCGWFFHTRGLGYAVGGSVILVALLGLSLYGAHKRRAALAPGVLFGLIWFALIGATAVRYARYGIPLIPLLAIGAGVGLALLPRGRFAAWRYVFAAALVGFPLLSSSLLSGSMALEPDPRDAALAAIEARAPRGGEIAVGRAVWFDMPPLDFNNGGDMLGRHTVWSEFRRSDWELATIPNFDTGRLLRERPRWFVASDFQFADWLRSEHPAASEFHRALGERYVEHAFRREWGWFTLGPCGPLPHDWSYPFTTVTLWERRDPEDSLPPRGN